MRIVLMTRDYPWHRALAARLAALPGVELVGIVQQADSTTRTWAWVRRMVFKDPIWVLRKVLNRLFFHAFIEGIDREALRIFGRPEWPVEPQVAGDINREGAYLQSLVPDLIVVSGTRLVKQPLFALGLPFLNLHTGISPYYKGGPNCTLWCLANGEPHRIGSTVHYLDEGIDSGPIIGTIQAKLQREDSAALCCCRAVEAGHELMLDSVARLERGEKLPMQPQQKIGRTYYAREWGPWQILKLRRFLRRGGLQGQIVVQHCGQHL